MISSGRVSWPCWTPSWGPVGGIAACPARAQYRRSEAVWAASGHAIFGSAARPGVTVAGGRVTR